MGAVQFNPEELRSRYQAQNAFGNNLRVTGGEPVEKTGQVGAVGYVGGDDYGVSTGRAVDKAPKAQMVQYDEYLPAQAGRDAGYSTKFMMA